MEKWISWRSVAFPTFFVRWWISITFFILFTGNLDTDFWYFVASWNISDRNILDRKITEYSTHLIDQVSMCMWIALVVCLSVNTRKSSEHPLFCHGFDISVDRRTANLWTFSSHLFIDIISRKMSTFASITDDLAVLVFSHAHIMRRNLKKSKKCLEQFFYFLHVFSILVHYQSYTSMNIRDLDWKKYTHIGLDLDETLASTISGMLEEAHVQGKLLGIQSLDDVHSYNFQSLDKSITEEEGYFIWESFWKKTMNPSQIPLVAWAKDGVGLFVSLKKNLSIITARSDQEEWKVIRTKNWISTYFPEIGKENIFFVNHFSHTALPKSVVCKNLGINLMIDDHIGNAQDLAENNIATILLEKPWNRHHRFEHPLIYRVKDWQEIIESLSHGK